MRLGFICFLLGALTRAHASPSSIDQKIIDTTKQPSVVSIDYCADQFVLALADRDQITALSDDADQVHSFYADRANGVPKFSGTAEEVLVMDPDIVVRYWAGDQKFQTMMKRFQIPVVTAAFGADFETVYQNITLIADALNQSERGKQTVENMKDRLTHSQTRNNLASSSQRATYVTPSGFTTGSDTFVHEIIVSAGLVNRPAELGLVGWHSLPLEEIVLSPPDMIVASFFDLKSNNVLNWSVARHTVMKKILAEKPTIFVPGKYLSCNGLFFIDAIEYIQDELVTLDASRS